MPFIVLFASKEMVDLNFKNNWKFYLVLIILFVFILVSQEHIDYVNPFFRILKR